MLLKRFYQRTTVEFIISDIANIVVKDIRVTSRLANRSA